LLAIGALAALAETIARPVVAAARRTRAFGLRAAV